MEKWGERCNLGGGQRGNFWQLRMIEALRLKQVRKSSVVQNRYPVGRPLLITAHAPPK